MLSICLSCLDKNICQKFEIRRKIDQLRHIRASHNVADVFYGLLNSRHAWAHIDTLLKYTTPPVWYSLCWILVLVRQPHFTSLGVGRCVLCQRLSFYYACDLHSVVHARRFGIRHDQEWHTVRCSVLGIGFHDSTQLVHGLASVSRQTVNECRP